MAILKYPFGGIRDRLRDAKYAASIGFAVMAIGMFILLQFRAVYGLYGCAALFGFGHGSIATIMPCLIADRFGSSILGPIYGILMFFVAAGACLGPILGVIFTTSRARAIWPGREVSHF